MLELSSLSSVASGFSTLIATRRSRCFCKRYLDSKSLSKYFRFRLLFCADFGSNFYLRRGGPQLSAYMDTLNSPNPVSSTKSSFLLTFYRFGGNFGYLGRIVVLFKHYNLRSNSKKFKPEDMERRLEGKNCVVTGANSGIGFGAAEGLAAR